MNENMENVMVFEEATQVMDGMSMESTGGKTLGKVVLITTGIGLIGLGAVKAVKAIKAKVAAKKAAKAEPIEVDYEEPVEE